MQVNFTGSNLFAERNYTIKEFEVFVSDESHKQALSFAVDRAGAPYSIKQLIAIAWYKLTGDSTMIKDGRKAYVCSELVAELLLEILGEKFDKDLDVVTPQDIYNLLEEKYNGKT